MPNMYKSFYFQDLLAMTNEIALEAMLETTCEDDCEHKNACIALYNDGIRDMAKAIARRLTEEASKSE